jgi:hypothetical protein
MVNATFTPFTIHQLFPSAEQPENDVKKLKATQLTNIFLEVLKNSDLTFAQKIANYHCGNLSQLNSAGKVEAYVVDIMLRRHLTDGLSEETLKKIALCYGYQFSMKRADDGVLVFLQGI